jgi:peroxiredoxin
MLSRLKISSALLLLAILASAAIAQLPQLTLRSVEGQSFNLAASRGKVVVLSFGATWVPLTSRELPALQKLADRYAGRNVSFYWVSINSTRPGARHYASDAELQAFAQRNGWRLTILRDPDQTAYRAFGVEALPTVVIIDAEGQLFGKYVGFDPQQAEAYADVARSLDQLLK